MKRPWKCPNCKYLSTRNWNVKSHIKLSHNGRGIPVQLGKRNVLSSNQSGETIIDHLQEPNLSSRLPTFFNDNSNNENEVTAFIRQFFGEADKQNKFLFEILEGLSPQFQEMEQLLNTISSTDLQKKEILARAIYNAIISPEPTTYMSDALATYRVLVTIQKMINCVSIAFKLNPELAKKMLKRLAFDKYLNANKNPNNDPGYNQ